MHTEALLNTKIKPLAMLAGFVILVASLATVSLQQIRHQVPPNQELTFRHTTLRKVSSYAILKGRVNHRINSLTDLAKHFKFLLLNFKINIAGQFEKVRKTTNPQPGYFIHRSLFCISSSDEEASHLLC